jgi:hypothetical protein
VPKPTSRVLFKLWEYLHSHPKPQKIAFLAQVVAATLGPRQIRVLEGKDPPPFFLTGMIRVKNEGPFIAEWLAYHLASGFEHVFLYDNGSTDNTKDIVRPFVTSGLVTYVSWPTSPISPAADLHFFKEHAHKSKWVAFFDADEFLVESNSGALLGVLKSCPEQPALAVNWRYFGSSFHEKIPSGLVIENFNRADGALNRHVKVIVQPKKVRRLRNSHNFYYQSGRLAKTVLGSLVFASFADTCGAKQSDLVLNHYVYRSREDYARKATRGVVEELKYGWARTNRHLSQIETEFPKHNSVLIQPPITAIARTKYLLSKLGAH